MHKLRRCILDTKDQRFLKEVKNKKKNKKQKEKKKKIFKDIVMA